MGLKGYQTWANESPKEQGEETLVVKVDGKLMFAKDNGEYRTTQYVAKFFRVIGDENYAWHGHWQWDFDKNEYIPPHPLTQEVIKFIGDYRPSIELIEKRIATAAGRVLRKINTGSWD
jgi:hypothetical protein